MNFFNNTNKQGKYKRFIPYGHQSIAEQDISAVVDVLKSDYLTQGPKIEEFEKALCDYTGARYAVVVSNGTAALDLAIKSLSIDSDFEGITSPNTFVASSNCIIYNAGKPVFADIQPDTHNIYPKEIEKKITEKTRVIIPVDFAGHPADLKEIRKIADEYSKKYSHKIYIIRDSCHAIGSAYFGEKTGNCKYADMTIFSFHPVKHITTGEGGAILTNNKALFEKLSLLRTHGITKDPDLMSKNDGVWYYEMIDLGYNYRMTDIQASLGISQLERLDAFVERRREIVKAYNTAFKDLDFIKLPVEKQYIKHSYHLYPVEIDFQKLGITRNEFMLKLRENGILTQVHYIPVHTQPYYQKAFSYKLGDFPVAEKYYDRALSFPMYPSMTNDDIDYVIKILKDIFGDIL